MRRNKKGDVVFRKAEYRKPVWRWPNELPIEGKPEDVTKAVSEYNQKLQKSI
jgi:hypothetical protein